MLNTIYDMIIARITAIGTFASVGSALTGDPGALPAAEVWMATDKSVTVTPSVTRHLFWVVRITVAHDDTPGASQAEMFGLLDGVRSSLEGWEPSDEYIGVKRWWSIPEIKIESYKDHGSMVYLVSLDVEVFPSTFKKKP